MELRPRLAADPRADAFGAVGTAFCSALPPMPLFEVLTKVVVLFLMSALVAAAYARANIAAWLVSPVWHRAISGTAMVLTLLFLIAVTYMGNLGSTVLAGLLGATIPGPVAKRINGTNKLAELERQLAADPELELRLRRAGLLERHDLWRSLNDEEKHS